MNQTTMIPIRRHVDPQAASNVCVSVFFVAETRNEYGRCQSVSIYVTSLNRLIIFFFVYRGIFRL